MRRAALAAAAALAAVTLARLPAAWESGSALNHVSGTWLALADDLARGTLYRPLSGEGGRVGGTRYFPLVFALEASLLRAGAGPVAAGLAVSLAAGLLLAAGLFLLLRAAGASRGEAAAGAALAFAGLAGQRAVADARGDLLPVALSALALAALARGRWWTAAPLLVLAFAAKPTALSAALAAALALALGGARRAALGLAAAVGAGGAAAVLATDALSSGRFLAALRLTGAAGLGPRSALAAPVRLASELAVEDPAGLVLALLGAAALAAAAPALARAARRGAPEPRLVPALWLAAAWATALAVYAAPGTGVNHLLEVEVASAALLAATAARARPAAARLAGAGCAVAAAAGLLAAGALWRADRTGGRLAELRALVAALPPGPILSEDPLVPLLAGASPIVLDPFALRTLAERAPAAVAPLEAALRGRALAAVVLLADPGAPHAAPWYARGNLGLPLVAGVRATYRPAGVLGRYHLYLPRGGAGPPGPATVDAGVVRRDAPR